MDPSKPSDTPPGADRERERQGDRQARKAPAPRPVTTHAFVAPVGGVVEGRAYFIDGHLVIADSTVDVGAQFHALTGTVEYAKVHEEAWIAGDPIFWYAAGGCLSNNTGLPMDPGTGRVQGLPETLKVGVADKDAPRPSVTGFVRLDTIPTP